LFQIEKDFESFDRFKEVFKEESVNHFASGWTWLLWDTKNRELRVTSTHDAGCPITLDNMVPLLTLDLWEHAYYIDFRNDRARYVDQWWDIANWEFAETNFTKAGGGVEAKEAADATLKEHKERVQHLSQKQNIIKMAQAVGIDTKKVDWKNKESVKKLHEEILQKAQENKEE